MVDSKNRWSGFTNPMVPSSRIQRLGNPPHNVDDAGIGIALSTVNAKFSSAQGQEAVRGYANESRRILTR